MPSRPLLAFAATLGFGTAVAPLPAGAASFITDSARQISVEGEKHFRKADTIVLPTCYVYLMNWGKVHEMAQRGNNVSHASMEVLSPMSEDVGREIGDRLYKDLADKLERAGWKVIRYAEVKDTPTMTQLKLRSPIRRPALRS